MLVKGGSLGTMAEPKPWTRQSCAGLVACLLLVLSCPTLAHGYDAVVCVSGGLSGLPSNCGLELCDTSEATYLDAMEQVTSLVALELPADPSVLICSQIPAGTPVQETLEVPPVDGALGAPLEIDFGGNILCPADPATQVGLPDPTVLKIIADAPLTLRNLTIDQSADSPCSHQDYGAIQLRSEASTTLEDLHILGTKSFGLRVQDGLGGGGPVEWRSGSLRGAGSSGVRTGSPLRLGRVLLHGNTASNELGPVSLIEATAPEGSLELEDTVFVGNLAFDVSGEDFALVRGPIQRAQRVTFAGNLLTGTSHLVILPFLDPLYSRAEGGEPLGRSSIFSDLLVVHNKFVSFNSSNGSPPRMAIRDVALPASGEPHCQGSLAGDIIESEFLSENSTSPGSGTLFLVEDDVVPPDHIELDLTMARSLFAGNQLSGAPMLGLDSSHNGTPPLRRIQFLQNTFRLDGGSLLSVSEGGDGVRVDLLRNIIINTDPSSQQPLLSSGAELGSVSATMNLYSWGGDFIEPLNVDLASSVLGPNLALPDLVPESSEWFEPPAATSGRTPCERFIRACPGASEDTCDEWTSRDSSFACGSPLLEGSFLPSSLLRAQLPTPWPWDTNFFNVSGHEGWVDPGFSGWTCLAERGGVDRWVNPSRPNLPLGDGDGQTDAIDCDNEDPEVFAQWPAEDGINTEDCLAPAGSCFICPKEKTEDPEQPPSEEEDKTEETLPEVIPPEDSSSPTFEVHEGCAESGWGYAWTCEQSSAQAALLILLGPAVLHRRRWRA